MFNLGGRWIVLREFGGWIGSQLSAAPAVLRNRRNGVFEDQLFVGA
jgi:hypothetical protein